MGNIVSIMGTNDEIAHYKYDAWGKCTITENVGGIAALNPFRWKSHYYDNESGLYYIGGRYYSPVMKSFISPCNIDEILYNISVPGNLNPYSIGNPMYFPMNRFNIFTSIPLTWDPPALTKWQSFWYDAFGWWNDLHWGWKVGIGVGTIGLLGVGAAFAGGAAGVVFGAGFHTAVGLGVSGVAWGTVIGGVSSAISGDNIFEGALNGAIDGFAIGSVMGGITGVAVSSLNIVTGGVKIIGSAQVNKATFFHRMASNIQAGKMAMQIGQYSGISLNSKLSTMGLNGGGLRPDVIGIARNGHHVLVEITSSSQTAMQMAMKLNRMIALNPGAIPVLINWAGILGRKLF